ncbi:hypothetical protein M433DRAFT_141413 [Acidomyces richmondensis BFW]|nr:MAG: hypothetical protein FE78DRAFT_250624 [Acidomyces sp. 'richmondensis']KYG48027.1 hypothetical protein M433DRAFT_141413 [Acidomyces richmondensis BFW]
MSSPVTNPLSASSLSLHMARSLPKDAQLTDAYEAIALAAHATFLTLGFRLVGLGENDKIETLSDSANPSPLPAEWNSAKNSYAFRYKHDQGSTDFLLSITKMGNMAVITAMSTGDDQPRSFSVKVLDFVCDGKLPSTPVTEERSVEEAARTIAEMFISNGRLSDFGSQIRVELIQKLLPKLQEGDYERTRGEISSSGRYHGPTSRREENNPIQDPLREDWDSPARPFPLHDPQSQPQVPLPEPIPNFEDELETQRGPRGMIPAGFPRIGERDLYPQGLGPHDPLRGALGPDLDPMGGGGMHPTFSDPLFTGQGQGRRDFDPRQPPGSRYDDPGPGFGGMPGHPRGAGLGGRPPNPFGGFGGNDYM